MIIEAYFDKGHATSQHKTREPKKMSSKGSTFCQGRVPINIYLREQLESLSYTVLSKRLRDIEEYSGRSAGLSSRQCGALVDAILRLQSTLGEQDKMPYGGQRRNDSVHTGMRDRHIDTETQHMEATKNHIGDGIVPRQDLDSIPRCKAQSSLAGDESMSTLLSQRPATEGQRRRECQRPQHKMETEFSAKFHNETVDVLLSDAPLQRSYMDDRGKVHFHDKDAESAEHDFDRELGRKARVPNYKYAVVNLTNQPQGVSVKKLAGGDGERDLGYFDCVGCPNSPHGVKGKACSPDAQKSSIINFGQITQEQEMFPTRSRVSSDAYSSRNQSSFEEVMRTSRRKKVETHDATKMHLGKDWVCIDDQDIRRRGHVEHKIDRDSIQVDWNIAESPQGCRHEKKHGARKVIQQRAVDVQNRNGEQHRRILSPDAGGREQYVHDNKIYENSSMKRSDDTRAFDGHSHPTPTRSHINNDMSVAHDSTSIANARKIKARQEKLHFNEVDTVSEILTNQSRPGHYRPQTVSNDRRLVHERLSVDYNHPDGRSLRGDVRRLGGSPQKDTVRLSSSLRSYAY